MSGERAGGVSLEAADFRLTNASGFGDGNNSYAHSMAWFEGHLYVGTTRGVFAMMRTNKPVPNFKPWPTEVPDSPYKVDRRAEIWRYTPATSGWDLVYRAPWVTGRTLAQVPRYIGFRGMTIFQSPGDAKPCLYVSTWAPREAEPPDILRSEDGATFASVPRPPWDTAVRSFRTLQVFRGRVHTAPTGSNKGGQAQESVGSEARVYCTDDLQSAHWVSAGEDGFGDPDNVTVFEMAAFADHLYAGTVNPTRGCELWKTDGEGGPPYRWQRVLSHGAGRGPHNEAIASMVVFRGALYVGTGIVNGGYHRAFEVGPAAAEVLRVWPDDSWDVLVGHSRITSDGLKVPLSGMAPGFDSLFNGYMWRMGVHDGHLYVGTFCWANMLPYLPRSLWPEDVLAMVERWGEDQLVRRYGGFELWRTADGVRWFPVTRSGFGNKYNWGVRNLVSTPHGLFVGTANVFGPRVAVRRDGEWRYIDNPRGGCEVWLGAREAV